MDDPMVPISVGCKFRLCAIATFCHHMSQVSNGSYRLQSNLTHSNVVVHRL